MSELQINEYKMQIGSTTFVIKYLDSGEWQLSYWPANRNHYHFGSPKKTARECVKFFVECSESKNAHWEKLLEKVSNFTFPPDANNLFRWMASLNSVL